MHQTVVPDKLIFTTHAQERMQLRRISEDEVRAVVTRPDTTRPEDKPQTTRFARTINNRSVQVIARHLPAEKKTLIISAWVRGEDDPAPLVWQVITTPFKLLYTVTRWAARRLWRQLRDAS